MANEPLQREVEVSPEPAQLTQLRRTIGALQVLYFLLFGASLLLLVVNFGHKSAEQHLWWALSLGGAVIVRLVRTSFVNKHNRLLAGGGPAPLS